MLFRNRHTKPVQPSPEQSLAKAEADRRRQEHKHDTEKPTVQKIGRLIDENNIAALLRQALGGGK